MFPGGKYYANTGIPLLNRFAAYAEIYRRQVWVHVVVRKLALGTARLPFEVRVRTATGTELADDTHPLAQLLARPNEQLDSYRLWLWTSATQNIHGEAYWLKLRDHNGVVRELQPMHPANVIVERDEGGELIYYYAAGVRDVSLLPPIPARDVVPFVEYNPETLARGMSTLEPLRETLYNEDAARRATASWWRRGARPSVALTHPGTLSEPAQARLRAMWDAQHAGADLMGGTAILEEGMKPEVLQLSAEEMQYIESRKLNREEVCAAYDLPPPVVHILDRATYSNITEQMRSLYRDTQAPRLGAFEAVIAHHLVPDFDRSGDTIARFNVDEVLRGDFESRASSVRELISSGVMMPSEARPLFGLNPAGPQADRLYANAALVPLGSSPRSGASGGEPAQLPSAEDGDDAEEGSGRARPALPAGSGGRRSPVTRAYTVRSVSGRLGRLKGRRDELRARLVDEHRDAMREYFARQHDAVRTALSEQDGKTARTAVTKAGVLLDGDQWNTELVALLIELGTVTMRMLGGAVAAQLGRDDYDPVAVAAWLAAGARTAADGINETTARGLADALHGQSDRLTAAGEYFTGLDGRADQIATSRVTVVGGMAEHDAAAYAGARTKTWVTGRHPRVSHEAMDGETVPIDAPFSNGMQRPGDPAGGADEIAGCNCHLSFSESD